MKCVCGYEHKSDVDEDGVWNDFLVGDEKFIRFVPDIFTIQIKNHSERKVCLYACPKCKTVQYDWFF